MARSTPLRTLVAAAIVPVALLSLRCGTDVDLGGTSAGADAGPPAANCAPCATGAGCVSGTCAEIAGDLFCGSVCGSDSDCASGETCSSVTSSGGAAVKVCVPASGACSPATSPASPDGGAIDHCGSLNGPDVASSCNACSKSSNDCQPNGCYGGYWCNEPARDCTPPPKTCS
jgi:hypothetical protein